MVIEARHFTAEDFDQFAELPENDDKLLEFIGGEIVEVPSNAYASSISSRISYFFTAHIIQNNIPGHVTGEAGGFMVSGERYAPDVAFISALKQPELAKRGYNPVPPDLAVEVDFPSTGESRDNLRIKIANYLAAGTVVWVFVIEPKQVEVYVPGQPVKILGVSDTLDGGDVLPGFKLAVKEIFPEEKKDE
jgi:Uma2 family endonuclease